MIAGLLDQLGTVYTADPTTGAFTVQAQASLACRVVHLATSGAATGEERAELAKRRVLMWDASYVMPANAQVLVGGERFNILEGTDSAPRGPSGAVVYRRAEAVRAV